MSGCNSNEFPINNYIAEKTSNFYCIRNAFAIVLCQYRALNFIGNAEQIKIKLYEYELEQIVRFVMMNIANIKIQNFQTLQFSLGIANFALKTFQTNYVLCSEFKRWTKKKVGSFWMNDSQRP